MPNPDNNVEVVKVHDDGKLTIPKKFRNDAQIKDGDHMKVTLLKDKSLLFQKIILASALFMFAFIFPFAGAYAQEAPAGNATATEPAAPQDEQQNISDAIDEILELTDPVIIPLPSEHARVPFRVEVTFKSGTGLIAAVLDTSPGMQDHYSVGTRVGTPTAGLSTTIFETEVVDTFNLIIADKYRSAEEQTVFIRFNANGTTADPIQIPLRDDAFMIQIKFVTSIAPHIPTPQENMAVILEPLNQILSLLGISIETNKDATNAFFTNSATLQAVTSFLLIIIILLGIAIIQQRHYNIQLQNYFGLVSDEDNPEVDKQKNKFFSWLKKWAKETQEEKQQQKGEEEA